MISQSWVALCMSTDFAHDNQLAICIISITHACRLQITASYIVSYMYRVVLRMHVDYKSLHPIAASSYSCIKPNN